MLLRLAVVLLLTVALARAATQCFGGTVALSSTSSGSLCNGPSCTVTFSMIMDLQARVLNGMGLLFNAPNVCFNEVAPSFTLNLQCTETPAPGGTTVSWVSSQTYVGGNPYYFVRWRYFGPTASCGDFNTTLAPPGLVLQQFEVNVLATGQPLPWSTTINTNPAYTLAALLKPCNVTGTPCLVPEPRCYASPAQMALVGGFQQPSGQCSTVNGVNACQLKWQFAVLPTINSVTKALTLRVTSFEVTFDQQFGTAQYCLSTTQNTSDAGFSCTKYTDLNSGLPKMRLEMLSTPFELSWIYNLFPYYANVTVNNTYLNVPTLNSTNGTYFRNVTNQTQVVTQFPSQLSCEQALFDPRFVTDQQNYTFGQDLLLIVNLFLSAGPTQWIETQRRTCQGGNATLANAQLCTTSADCPGNQTCATRLDELQLLQVPCPLSMPSCSASPTPSNTPSNSVTPTISETPSVSETRTPTSSRSSTSSPTPSRSPTSSPSESRTPSTSPSTSQSPSNSRTPTRTPTTSRSSSTSPSNSRSSAPSNSATPTISNSPSNTPSTGAGSGSGTGTGSGGAGNDDAVWKWTAVTFISLSVVLGVFCLCGAGLAYTWWAARVSERPDAVVVYGDRDYESQRRPLTTAVTELRELDINTSLATTAPRPRRAGLNL